MASTGNQGNLARPVPPGKKPSSVRPKQKQLPPKPTVSYAPDHPVAGGPLFSVEELKELMKCQCCSSFFMPRLPVFPISQVYRCKELHKICVECKGKYDRCQLCWKDPGIKKKRVVDTLFSENQFAAYDFCHRPENNLIVKCDLCQFEVFTFGEEEHRRRKHPVTPARVKREEKLGDVWVHLGEDSVPEDIASEHQSALEYYGQDEVVVSESPSHAVPPENKCPFVSCEAEQSIEHLKTVHNFNADIKVDRSMLITTETFKGCFRISSGMRSVMFPLSKDKEDEDILSVSRAEDAFAFEILSKNTEFYFEVSGHYTDKNRLRHVIKTQIINPVLVLKDAQCGGSREETEELLVFFSVKRKENAGGQDIPVSPLKSPIILSPKSKKPKGKLVLTLKKKNS